MPKGVYDKRLNPHCEDLRPCFARKDKHCTILLTTYAQGECPFAKRKQSDKLSYFDNCCESSAWRIKMAEFFLKVKYEDGHSHWIKEPMEEAGLKEAKITAQKKVKQLNSAFVSSITGKVVEYEIHKPTLCERSTVK